MKKTFLIILGFFFLHTAFSQVDKEDLKQTIKQMPIDEAVQFSGSFAELRGTHLHGGADIRTNAEEGKVIRAVMDGYITKIQVDIGGYGKNIHIKHPNGLTSIYGHLREFAPKIAKYVRKCQEEKMNDTLTVFPSEKKFKVKAGDQIGWSGNTGHSGGPHLHFELRDQEGKTQLNPLNLGIPTDDKYAPVIESIAVYPESRNVYEAMREYPNYYKCVVKSDAENIYGLETKHVLAVPECFSLGIFAWDRPGENLNHNGVYAYNVYVDGDVLFHLQMDKVDLQEVDDYYTILDYPKYEETGKYYLKTRREPNSKVAMYNSLINEGMICITDTLIHQVKVVVNDYAGNTSVIEFPIKIKDPSLLNCTAAEVAFNESAELSLGDLLVSIPTNGLYKTSYIKLERLPKIEGAIEHFKIGGDRMEPAAKAFEIVYQIPQELIPIQDKLYWLRRTPRNKCISINSSEVKQGKLITSTRFFGKYELHIDTLAPEVKLISEDIMNAKRGDTLAFQVKDVKSGIKSYQAKLNGKWVLLEYEPKKDLMFYKLDRSWKRKKNLFTIEVIDKKGNLQSRTYNFK